MLGLVQSLGLLLVASIILARRMRQHARWEQRLLWASLFAHYASAFAVIAITKYYYGDGDMLGYHRSGTVIARHLVTDFDGVAPKLVALLFQTGGEDLVLYGGGTATGSMHAVAAFLSVPFNNSLVAICTFLGLLAFFSKLAIYRVLRAELAPQYWRLVLIATMLVPSVVFWSSGLIKEAMAIIFLGPMIAGGYGLFRGNMRAFSLVLLGVGIVGCGIFKGYLLVPFALGGAAFVYVDRSRNSSRSLLSSPTRLILAGAAAFALLIAIGSVLPRYDFREAQDQFEHETAQAENVSGGSNYAAISQNPGSTLSLVVNAPWAVTTSLLRPFIFEARNPLALVNGLETLFLAILLFRVFSRTGAKRSLGLITNSRLLSFCAIFTLILALGVGFSTSNLGTLSRYRMPLVPFFVTVLAVLSTKHNTAPKRSSLVR